MSFKIAVIGATGNVGREMLKVLAKRGLPASQVVALASYKSIAQEVPYGNDILNVQGLKGFDFSEIDISLMSAGKSVAQEWAEKIAAQGCVVIDNSSHFRMDPEVPLVVPEVNGNALKGYAKKNIIANPNCSTAQMVLALKPLHDLAAIKRVVVSTYQSVSGSGKAGPEELRKQTRAVLAHEPVETSVYTKQIAFNVIPHIDDFLENGNTREEWKMAAETSKIFGRRIPVTATCVRVPVFVGHAEALNIEFHDPVTEDQARKALEKAPGIKVVDARRDGGYATPLECAGCYATYVSRIRKDNTLIHGLNLWVVSDNLLKGAALNAVQIAETLRDKFLKK